MDYPTYTRYHGYIKEEPVDNYGRGPAQGTVSSEHKEDWTYPFQREDSRQTLSAGSYNVQNMGTSGSRVEGGLNGSLSSLPRPSVSDKNKFQAPPFRELVEFAARGEEDLSSLPNVPANLYAIDGAFLNSSSPFGRHTSQLPGQYELPVSSGQGSVYAPTSGHAYPRNMPAPRVLPHTMDPSRLLHRQSPPLALQGEFASDSDVEVDDESGSDGGRDQRFGTDDAAGWGNHPDTIDMGSPNFFNTEIKGDMRDAAGVQVPVDIKAQFVLKKKAAKQSDCWILYRRNYFNIQGSYKLKPFLDSSPDETLYLHQNRHKPEPIQALFMCMRGVVGREEGSEIKIVVFNAKRKPIHQGIEPPPIAPQRMKPLTDGSTKYYVKSTGDRHDHINVPMNHTFNRNQFRAATQNNGARRTEQQFYHILLELKAEIIVDGLPQLFTVASKMSEALVVRGRCPLSFKGKDKDGDRNRKARKLPRDEGGNKSRRHSTVQSEKERHAKRASRGSCYVTGGSSRRSTRTSSNVPTLTFGTGSRSANTNPVSPLPTSYASYANGIVNGETIPDLDYKLRTLTGESWEGDPRWLDGHDSI